MSVCEAPILAPAACSEATPLLQHLAGDFASRIAELWPAPHRPFVEAEAARRHLVCLALATSDGALPQHLALTALGAPLRRAVSTLAPDAPTGLTRALSRLGEVAWTAAGYRQLISALANPGSAAFVHHRIDLSPEFVVTLERLGALLHVANALASVGLNDEQAALLSALHGALIRRDGEVAADEAARRWAVGSSVNDIFARAQQSVRRPLRTPPFPSQGQLRAIRTLDELDDAGGRFGNCLSTLCYAGDVEYAWFEWLGEPGVIIELLDDRLYGWTLTQARCRRNAAVPAETRAEISTVLRALGVHLGVTGFGFRDLLEEAAAGRPLTSLEQTLAWCYGD